MNHAERVREAEQTLIEKAVEYGTYKEYNSVHLCHAVDMLLALRAATCPTCEGYGVNARISQKAPDWEEKRYIEPCPAGCDNGRTR